GYLYSLRVMQPLRGLGIGTQLVKRAEDTLLDRGFSWATIAVAKDNARARTLYARLGYQIFTEAPGRWSFVDPDGNVHRVNEPCYGLEKQIRSLSAVRHKQ
ncbi:MAG: GNAT family N-acetyltransferase, partial [Anaerolineae bacterium]